MQNVLTGQMPFLSPNKQHQSTEGLINISKVSIFQVYKTNNYQF